MTDTPPFVSVPPVPAIVSDLHLRPSSLQTKPGFTSNLPLWNAIPTMPFMLKSCSRNKNAVLHSALANKSRGTSSNLAQIVSFEIHRNSSQSDPGTTPKNMMMNSQSSQRMVRPMDLNPHTKHEQSDTK